MVLPVEPVDPACAQASLSEVARFLQGASTSLRDSLVVLAGAVRQADGLHVDQGPGTAAVRGASRKVAGAAEAAAEALAALEVALTELATAEKGGPGGSAG